MIIDNIFKHFLLLRFCYKLILSWWFSLFILLLTGSSCSGSMTSIVCLLAGLLDSTVFKKRVHSETRCRCLAWAIFPCLRFGKRHANENLLCGLKKDWCFHLVKLCITITYCVWMGYIYSRLNVLPKWHLSAIVICNPGVASLELPLDFFKTPDRFLESSWTLY